MVARLNKTFILLVIFCQISIVMTSRRNIVTQSNFQVRSSHDIVTKNALANKVKNFCIDTFPIIDWVSEYSIRRDLVKDILAGITVTVLQVPQGIAYGFLANLPPICGIYTGIISTIIYAIFGSSHHNNMGVFSVVCLMTGAVITKYTPNEKNLYIGEVDERARVNVLSTLTFTCSLFLIGMYILRLGIITNILSETLLNAFTAGCAIHLIATQIKELLGLELEPLKETYMKPFFRIYDVYCHIDQCNTMALGISSAAVVVLIVNNEFFKPWLSTKISVPFPIEMILVVIGTLSSYFFDLNKNFNVPIIGHISLGPPVVVIPQFDLIPLLALDSAFIALVAYITTMSMGFTFARKGSYQVNPNQELLALGLVNFVGTFFQCIPTCASLSRSLVQYNVGGVSQFCCLVQTFLVFLILVFCGPALKYVPKCILAAIILTSIFKTLYHIKKVRRYWQLSRRDGLIYIVTIVGTVVQIQIGLIGGIISAICVIFSHYWKPNAYIMGRVPDMELYMCTRFKEVQQVPNIKIFRYEGGLNFASKNAFRKVLSDKVGINAKKIKADQRKAFRKLKEGQSLEPFVTDIKVIILDLSTLNHVDPAGSKTLRNLESDYRDIGITVLLVSPSDGMKKTLQTYDAIEAPEHYYIYFVSIHDAVLYAQQYILNN